MSYPRKDGYMPEYEICSHEVHAFAHPARFQILKILSERSLTHEHLSYQLPLHPTTVSHHLRVLMERNLVKYREDHPWIYYSLNRPALEKTLRNLSLSLGDILG